MKHKKLDRIAFFSAMLSLAMMTVFSFARFFAEKEKLPLGYHYRIYSNGRLIRGKIKTIEPTATAALWEAAPGAKKIVFSTNVFLPRSGQIFLHTDRPEEIEVHLNGAKIQTSGREYFNPMKMNRGFNRLFIRFSPKVNTHMGLKIALTESAVLSPFPFYYMIPPGGSFSSGKLLFSMMRFIDLFKSSGFILALLILIFRMFLLWKEPVADEVRTGKISLWFLVFQFFLVLLSLQILTAQIMDMANFHVSFPFIWIIPAIAAGAFTWMRNRKRSLHKKIDPRTAVMAGFSILIVSGFVFFQSGRFFPRENIGYGDLNNHLVMLKNIECKGEFLNEDHKQIYPQATHAVIVSWAKLLGMESEEILTPLIMGFLVCLVFTLFLIGNTILPRIPLVFWLLAMAFARWPSFFQGVFFSYSFPAALAVMLFLVSLYFKSRGENISSAVIITASLAVYPYFAVPFAFTYAMLSLRGKFPPEARNLIKTSAELLPAFLILFVFFRRFFQYNLPSRHMGFSAPFLWNPFEALHFWNTFLILSGILVILAAYKKGIFSALCLGITIGFLANYTVYAVFHSTSTYYVMKNVLYLIPMGVIPAAAVISVIFKALYRRPVFKITLCLLPPLFFTAFFMQAVQKLPSPAARGVTDTKRWLLEHSKQGETIVLAANDTNLSSLFNLTLGNRRPVRAVNPSDLSSINNERWLILDTRVSSSPPAAVLWKRAFHTGDFVIYKRY